MMRIGIQINTLEVNAEAPLSEEQISIIKRLKEKGHDIVIVLNMKEYEGELTCLNKAGKYIEEVIRQFLEENKVPFDSIISTLDTQRDICVNNGINYLVKDQLNEETFESIVGLKHSVEDIMRELFHVDIHKLPRKAQKGLADVEYNHDCSWVRDLYEKAKKERHLGKTAIFYRGTKITYFELFKKAEEYAFIFSNKGIKAGDEVPMCMGNCPEFLYTIMGLNLLGAKMNCFGAFDEDYITEIINECNSPFMICTDDQYPLIRQSIKNSLINEVVLFSLADSLPNGVNPYAELDSDYYDFADRVSEYQKEDKRIISGKKFFSIIGVENIPSLESYNYGDLSTEFLVTYSSGSTNASRPKAIIHTNRSLITIGRFQDPDLSGLPKMNNLIGEAMIPTHSNTGIISSMSDVLYKGCTVAQEPIYHRDFLLLSLMINKPNYIATTRTMIVEAAKKMYYDIRYKGFEMPYMMMLTSVGEPTSKGEELFVNEMLKKAKCGCSKYPRPFAPVPLSIGGGDCERGGMFFTPYRAYQDLKPIYSLSKTNCFLRPYPMVQTAILDKDNKILPKESIGRLVAKTPTTMKCYKNNDEATRNFYLNDSEGHTWSDCGCYALIEKCGTVEMLERIGKELIMSDGSKTPLYAIGKVIEKDTVNILSYEVVNINNTLVIHIEVQPKSVISEQQLIDSIHKRISLSFGDEVSTNIYYRIRSHKEGFPSTKCEKRSYVSLVQEGITDFCKKPSENNKRRIMLAL